MKVSLSWLRDYIDINLAPEQLSELLTDCGLEVESVDNVSSIPGGLRGLVIGEVKEKAKHPNADRLSITKVDIGKNQPLSIVCGAPNVEAGQKVIVAPVGTVLHPVEGESFKIKEGKIRGEVSQGMICAEDEIGLGDEHDGIIVLDASAPVGGVAKDYFNVLEDIVFDIGLTPNRVDAASHYGVARDIAAVLTFHGKDTIRPSKPSVDSFSVTNNSLSIPVTVEDSNACPRYCGVSMTNIKVGPSPGWLSNKIKAIGLSPINNVVDITNFVLHETGQPLHAFDADKIQGKKVVVKNLKQGAEFITLDGVARKLSSEDLMICNGKTGMCIAGVFGGLGSGVTENTKSLFLESAYFESMGIRKTAKYHGLNTDSSFRFERGADPNNTLYALKRAALLIQELTGGSISSDIIDIYPNPIDDFKVSFLYENCNRLIGQVVDKDSIKRILTSLEIEIVKETEMGLDLIVPVYRADVRREADIIEEILRIYGYNNVSIDQPARYSVMAANILVHDGSKETTADLLASKGFVEIMCNSITNSSFYGKDETLVEIMNPLNADLHALRSSMLHGGLEAITRNQNHQRPDLKLFEFGYTYNKENKGYTENPYLAIFITGRKDPEGWAGSNDSVGFYYLKGIVTSIISRLGVGKPGIAMENNRSSGLSGQTWKILNKEVGFVGEVDAALLKKRGIKKSVYYACINWFEIASLLETNNIKYQELPKYPEVRRDLALLLDDSVEYKEVEEVAKKIGKKLLKSITLFDVYQGDNIPKGKMSYAVGFVFRDNEKTLKDADIDGVMKELIEGFEKKLKAEIR